MVDTHKREEGARTKATTGSIDVAGPQLIGGEHKFCQRPEFLTKRNKIWDELYAAQEEKVKGWAHEPIKVTLPDGNIKEGVSLETSPLDIATKISKQLAGKIVVAHVRYPNGRKNTLDEGLHNPAVDAAGEKGDGWMEWDATRPFEGDAELQLFTFDTPEGKETFWHSSAHVLGQSLETEFGVHLTHGPPTDEGFFYDSYTGKDIFTDKSYKKIEDAAKKIVQGKQKFFRLVLTKEEALHMFGDNPFKVSLITGKIPDGGKVTAYRNGDLIDLCTGPHIPSTQIIKAFKVTKNSSSHWLAKVDNDSLQRVYGISFPSKKEMDEYIHFKEEAEKRDHRNVGRQQKLFDMHELSPGCGFFYPQGTKIYNKLTELIRREYRVRGYQETISPNVFNLKLWKTSGHYANYKKNLFMFQVEKQGFGMKPMNCPAHCLMFDNQIRSYRDMPIRFADFGVLHRNEISGALSGLTRVRRFCQDDAHHFCMPEQLMDEVMGCLDFLDHVYSIFGFNFELELSTRPEERLGDDALWDEAEAALEKALNKFGRPWKENPGDGAFYGPKIDIKVYDALKRPHQCGTIQCDFQLPIRFNLQYQAQDAAKEQEAASQNKDKPKKELGTQLFKGDEVDPVDFTWREQHLKPGFRRPVIVHRAILGSVERFMAILIEHLAGKWPFWLSPRQVIVLPISDKASAYCHQVQKYIHKNGFECSVDESQGRVDKKVRNAQLAQWNYILVAGEDEMKAGLVDVRTRDNKRHGKMRVDDLVAHLNTLEPQVSNAESKYYEGAWDPSNYPKEGAKVEEVKSAPASANNPKVQAIEDALKGGAQWVGGAQPTQADKKAFEDLNGQMPDVAKFPHTFGWYALVSKMTPATQASWPEKAAAAGPSKPGKARKGKQEKKVVEKPAAKKEEDDFDPFADDDEDDAEAAAALKQKAADAKAKKAKAAPIAKSIIVWEVKPWGEETNLDELAADILKIEMDGLFWKTEYKKEPIAYGVFKLIIGAVVEDLKVSTDDVAEKIEAMEDHVQSVDIQSFNKL